MGGPQPAHVILLYRRCVRPVRSIARGSPETTWLPVRWLHCNDRRLLRAPPPPYRSGFLSSARGPEVPVSILPLDILNIGDWNRPHDTALTYFHDEC